MYEDPAELRQQQPALRMFERLVGPNHGSSMCSEQRAGVINLTASSAAKPIIAAKWPRSHPEGRRALSAPCVLAAWRKGDERASR
jgi:hypothetical protein